MKAPTWLCTTPAQAFGGLLDRAGLIMPLDEAYERFGWNESLYLIAKENTQFDGVTYGVGNELDRFYLFYNKRIFEEQGLNPPQKPTGAFGVM